MSYTLIQGYALLNREQRQLLKEIRELHLSSISEFSKQLYDLYNLVMVEYDPDVDCLRVFYRNGDYFDYSRDFLWS